MNSVLNELSKLALLTGPVFYKLLFMSLTAVIIGGIVLLIRRIADRKIPPLWKYVLWCLVLAALLVPYRPQSNLALIPNALQFEDVSTRAQYDKLSDEAKALGETEDPTGVELMKIDTAKKQQDALYVKTLAIDTALPLLWLFGMAVTGMFLVISRIKLSVKIKRHTIAGDGRYDRVLRECRDALGIRRGIGLIVQDYISSPAVLGIFNLKIILPDYAGQLDGESLRYIFLHELSHIKRKDMLVNSLLIAFQAVYWFNPAVWVLFKFFREDIELLNDAYVLKQTGPGQEKQYALSLVEILGRSRRIHLTPRLLCMVDGKDNIKRRITMIKLGVVFKKHKIAAAGVCIVIIAAIGVLFLTQGKLTTYEDEKFTLQYPKSWIQVRDNMSQAEISTVYEKTGVDQEWIDGMLDNFKVLFIDTEHSTDEEISLLSISASRGKLLLDLEPDASLDRVKDMCLTYGEIGSNFSFLEEPHFKELGNMEYIICSMRVHDDYSVYEAYVNGKYSTYIFRYSLGSGTIDAEAVKVMERLLSSFELAE